MEPLSTLCNDDAWCKKITCLARALVALASAIPRLPKYCDIPESSQQALFQFIFIPLAVRNICISLLIYTEKLKLAIFCQCLERKLNINRSVLTPCWCPKIELNYYSNVVFVSIEKHGLVIVIITIITNLVPRSPKVIRKEDLVKFDFEHAQCQRGPKYGLFYHCACSYSVL